MRSTIYWLLYNQHYAIINVELFFQRMMTMTTTQVRVITIATPKGGVGKSTVAYNLAYYAAKFGRVLLIDGDHSTNLTLSFSEKINTENGKSILDIFKKSKKSLIMEPDTTMIQPADENIDIIPGSSLLTEEHLDLSRISHKCLFMYYWISCNYEELAKNYDYILIDTHNDTSLITRDFIAVSDIVVAVTDPSKNGLRAYFQLKQEIQKLEDELFDENEKVSYVNTKPFLILNNLKTNGTTGNHIKNDIKDIPELVGIIPEKELMRISTSYDISVYQQYDQFQNYKKKLHQPFFDQLNQTFQNILNAANNAERTEIDG